MKLIKSIIVLIFLLAQATTSTSTTDNPPTLPDEIFFLEQNSTTSSQPHEDLVTRAVNAPANTTAVFQNVLVKEKAFVKNDLKIGGSTIITGNLVVDGTTTAAGNNFVTGPLSSTLNAVPRYADNTGSLIKDSSVFVDDAGSIQIDGITKNGNTTYWPSVIGPVNTFLASDGAGNLIYTTPAGGGNVESAVPFAADNRILRTNLPDGSSSIQESGISLDDSNNITGVNTLTATTVNAALNGNAATATTATNATNATTATSFSDPLVGDVTGNQTNTVVATVGGQTATNVAAATVLANAATTNNTASTIVRRDSSGNFTAGTMTGNVTGAASLNTLKAGDTMTGSLNMAAQSELRLQDAAGGQYVGLRAPTTIPTSYTLDWPTIPPTAGQFFKATSGTAMEWANINAAPSATKTYYVSKNGSDSNDGSFNLPFATVKFAVAQANMVASSLNRVTIEVGAGIFAEDNSGGPIAITAPGITLAGSSTISTIITPTTPSINLFSCTTATVQFINFTMSGSSSTASAVSLVTNSAGIGGFEALIVSGFQTGISISSAAGLPIILFDGVQFLSNTTGLTINNIRVIFRNSAFSGAVVGSTPVNTGMVITGSTALVSVLSSLFNVIETGVSVAGGGSLRLTGSNFVSSTNSIVASGASKADVTGCNFINNNSSSINVNASGAGTTVSITGSNFQCADTSSDPQGTTIKCTDAAAIRLDSSAIDSAVVAIECGTSGDTSTTFISANSVELSNCTTDAMQAGTSTLNFVGGVFTPSKVTIEDTTNVGFSAFNAGISPANLAIGNTTDEQQTLYQVLNSTSDTPILAYYPDYYGSKGTVYQSPTNDAAFNGIQATNNNASYYVVTSDRTKQSGINLISDAGNIGNSDNVRGWSINKAATSAKLNFDYSNNDTSGQAERGSNPVMVLNGFDNQVEFPTAANTPLPTNTEAHLVWAGDTTLYRSAANVLKTDGNLVVAGLTANRALTSNASSQLTPSATTSTELGYLSGTTSAVQTQLDGKVADTGDTMTGALQLPAGSTGAPSLKFTGSTTTGLSATSDNLSLSTAGAERLKISSAGIVSINGLSTGLVKTDSSGVVSAATLVNADVSASAAIADTKLATISTAGKVANSATTATNANTASAIVARDGSGAFAASTITANLIGNVTGSATSATDFTGALVGNVTGTQGATVVATVGGQSAASVATAAVLANAATATNTASAIVRRDGSGDFAAGTITADLIGNVTGNVTGELTGNATTATSTTDFSGALVGDVTGTQGATVVATVGGESAADIATATAAANDATNTNTADAIVKRDSNGDFAASTITADLIGNVTGDLTGNAATASAATTATSFSGSLVGDVTGTQGATVVAAVGGQTAASVATATSAANAATATNTAGTIPRRDGSGSFAAGTITASLIGNVTGSVTGNVSGNATTATSATTATTATNFTGPLAGDVTGTQSATVVNLINGQTASTISAGASLANAATANNTNSAIVRRDGSGKFNAGMISLSDTVTNPTDVTTKEYVDAAVSSGFTPHDAAVALSTTNVSLSGLQTIDGVVLVTNNRVLLINQTNPIENGLWLSQTGAWTRPTDFALGDQAGTAYVLITSGTINAGTSWVCDTPAAIIDTDPITFVQFSLAGQITAANVGGQTGQLFRDKIGNTLNFKTIGSGNSHISITNNTDTVILTSDATNANTPGATVARDGSGDFAANTITAALIGAASSNVLKAGDTMSGNLNMAAQSEVRLQDAAGGQYVGLRAPTTIPASYTVDLPTAPPTTGQVLKATSTTATQWANIDAAPSATKTFYVAKNGSDSNDGSFSLPFATVKFAVSQANLVASTINPVIIQIGAGVFAEDNSGGPITITAPGITLAGSSVISTIITPTTASINLFSCTTATIRFVDFTMSGSPSSTASAVSLATNVAGRGGFTAISVSQFQTGFDISSAAGAPIILFDGVQFIGNTTSIAINNIRAIVRNSVFGGPLAGSTPANTAISITGSTAIVAALSTLFNSMLTTIAAADGSSLRMVGSNIVLCTNGIVASGASKAEITGSNFSNNNASSININASGAGTTVSITGSNFQCADTSSVARGTAIRCRDAAIVRLDSSAIDSAVVALECGTSGNTSSTFISANSVELSNCTADVVQVGTSTLNFVGGVFNPSKVTIADAANVGFSAFNAGTSPANLAIGNTTDEEQTLYQVLNSTANTPILAYKPDYYGSKGTVYQSSTSDAAFNGIQATNNNASYYVVTSDRTKQSGINLISDAGNIGNSDNVRGWSINKAATSAKLNFDYSNNDTSGQAERASNPVMVLNGFDNQVEFPTAANTPLPTNTEAHLVWAGDTTLYRSAANVLKTDGNLVVAGLTANRALTSNASSQLTPSATTSTELSYLSGTTSAVQTQLDGKVADTGDTMTGALQLPAGSTGAPSLKFTGSTTTGLSATSDNLSLSTAGAERLKISSAGVVSINGLSTGLVKTDSSGVVSAATLVNADINSAAAIADTKLATISTAGKVANSATTATNANTASAIVARDSSGNFAATTITANLTGNVTGSATSATNFTGSLVGDVTGTQGTTVVSTAGGQSAANIAAATVLANAATNANTASAIVRRDSSGNFTASTVTANLTGNVTGSLTGNASTATTATNFSGSLVGNVTGTQGATVVASVGGQSAASVATAAVAANAATATNTAGAIARRDGSGGFAAGTITADLVGNVTGNVSGNAATATAATTATSFSGSLVGDVTGTQGATVVSAVGGQSAASVATAAIAANAATASNTAGTIPRRDGSGNFAAGTITASLIGNVSGNATTATTATSFSGSLVGDVTGTQGATAVAAVGGQTAANVAAGAVLANAATADNTASAIVRRDGSGNFTADTITANLTGSVTGAASLNVLKAGDTMTGSLTLPAGTTASPSLKFTGSSNTGITAQTANTLSFDTSGTERMNIDTVINTVAALAVKNVYASQSTQAVAPASSSTITVTSGISLLLLTHTANRTGVTVTFPPSPIDGQIFTIMLGTTNTITFTAFNGGTGGATVVSPLTGLAPASAPTATANGNSVTYLYYSTANRWYRMARG